MSSQVRPVSAPRTTPAPQVPWTSVAVLIFGAGVLTSAVLAWSVTLLVVGVLVVLGALAATAALIRPGAND